MLFFVFVFRRYIDIDIDNEIIDYMIEELEGLEELEKLEELEEDINPDTAIYYWNSVIEHYSGYEFKSHFGL